MLCDIESLTEYTKLYNSAEKSKIKDFNKHRNNPLTIIVYWPKNTEEYFHPHSPNKINLSEKPITKNVTNDTNTIVNHFNYREQIMIGVQETFFELDNKRVNQ